MECRTFAGSVGGSLSSSHARLTWGGGGCSTESKLSVTGMDGITIGAGGEGGVPVPVPVPEPCVGGWCTAASKLVGADGGGAVLTACFPLTGRGLGEGSFTRGGVVLVLVLVVVEEEGGGGVMFARGTGDGLFGWYWYMLLSDGRGDSLPMGLGGGPMARCGVAGAEEEVGGADGSDGAEGGNGGRRLLLNRCPKRLCDLSSSLLDVSVGAGPDGGAPPSSTSADTMGCFVVSAAPLPPAADMSLLLLVLFPISPGAGF